MSLATQDTLVGSEFDSDSDDYGDERCFKDPVWDLIKFGPFICKIIDTPQFQRLRYLKQLGVSYFVFPGASHNRFEHCLGTAHLAEKLVLHLRNRQPKLGITDRDVQCVTIAGLCHDLGHGPFSHVFDNHFIPEAKGCRADGSMWCHEEASEMMFDALVNSEENEIELSQDRVEFIKDLIRGEPRLSIHHNPPEKPFLFEIVANKRNGIDVDKWDYISRDARVTGVACTFSATRLIEAARVSADGQTIAYNWKDSQSVCELFQSRYSLHRRVYNHKTSIAVEKMVVDALLAAEPVFRLSESIDNPAKYLHLTDSILEDIEKSEDPRLEKSKKILRDLRLRKIPKRVEEKHIDWRFKGLWGPKLTPKAVAEMSACLIEEAKKMEEARRTILRDSSASNTRGGSRPAPPKPIDLLPPAELDGTSPHISPTAQPLAEDDIIITWSMLHFGMKDKDPMDAVAFWGKGFPNEISFFRADQCGYLRPRFFQELILRCYARDESKGYQVQKAFRAVLDTLPSDFEEDSPRQDGAIAMEASVSAPPPSTPAAPSTQSPKSPSLAHGRRKSVGTPYANHPNRFNDIPATPRTPKAPESRKREAPGILAGSPTQKRKRT